MGAYSGILWHTLAYSGILWHTLAYSGILWHTLAYSCILLHTLAYSDILWHILAYSGILSYGQILDIKVSKWPSLANLKDHFQMITSTLAGRFSYGSHVIFLNVHIRVI